MGKFGKLFIGCWVLGSSEKFCAQHPHHSPEELERWWNEIFLFIVSSSRKNSKGNPLWDLQKFSAPLHHRKYFSNIAIFLQKVRKSKQIFSHQQNGNFLTICRVYFEFLQKNVCLCARISENWIRYFRGISRNIKFDLRRKTNEETFLFFFRIVNAILMLVRFSALGHSISFWRKWNFHTYIYFTFTPELTTNDDNESEFSCLSTDRFLGRDYPVDGEKLAKVHRARTTAPR